MIFRNQSNIIFCFKYFYPNNASSKNANTGTINRIITMMSFTVFIVGFFAHKSVIIEIIVITK